MEKVTIKKSDVKFLIIGKIVAYGIIWALSVGGFIWAFLQNTIY